MHIAIPEQYREYFTNGQVRVVFWKKGTLLLANQKEYEYLANADKESRICHSDGTVGTINHDNIVIAISNGSIEVPDLYTQSLRKESMVFRATKAGIFLS